MVVSLRGGSTSITTYMIVNRPRTVLWRHGVVCVVGVGSKILNTSNDSYNFLNASNKRKMQ